MDFENKKLSVYGPEDKKMKKIMKSTMRKQRLAK